MEGGVTQITTWRELRLEYVAMQERLVLWAYEQTGGNKDRAARLIGMHRRQFQRIFNRHKEAQR
jgi:ActR/RegA family two-component response regulator